jgi:hypothetical protein
MKRNLLKDGFRAEDFKLGQYAAAVLNAYPDLLEHLKLINEETARQANALLRQHLGEPVRVGRNDADYGVGEWREPDAEPYPEGWTDTAYLVCREKVEGEK